MESVKNWTKEEFKAYMLIYASESDHTVSEEEKEMLESRLDQDLLKKIGKQIKDDNDYQRLQKVSAYIQGNDCTQSELDVLLNEMKEMFMSDGDFDVMEQATFRFMKKMLKV
ncbi:MAG: hypothetical protein HOB54_02710 [Flavobacteriales bacterium]|jgi:hypothetical protein|nr:hypothetical protein [Flavobacteriales bacterium]MBT5614742.1 hypothetical protein [Flavobacteriales bacterium]MBT6650263.1 hypothetical protein [Flavobacteriales bacterium]MBT6964730.1 hypothetical protein [Flavobacteriales bacterium]MDG2263683.1 hypothetical protein [Flavobacteriales bacterium]